MKHPLIKACEEARRFPDNTCSASRHAQMIGEAMVTGLTGPSAGPEDARDRGESILATVQALWEARTMLAEVRNDLQHQVDCMDNVIDEQRFMKALERELGPEARTELARLRGE